jgi:predicted RNA-binding protein with RPS1 domain
VDGLLHVSEIPRSRQAELREAVTARAELAVLIVGVDAAKRRISLALAPDEEPDDTRAYLPEAPKRGGGFGVTLGERLRQSRRA